MLNDLSLVRGLGISCHVAQKSRLAEKNPLLREGRRAIKQQFQATAVLIRRRSLRDRPNATPAPAIGRGPGTRVGSS